MARIRNAFGVPFIISSPPKVEFTRAKDAARPAGICEFQNYLYRARLIYDFRLNFRDRGAESFSKAFQHFRLSRLLHPKLSLWHSALETCTRLEQFYFESFAFFFFFRFVRIYFFLFFFWIDKDFDFVGNMHYHAFWIRCFISREAIFFIIIRIFGWDFDLRLFLIKIDELERFVGKLFRFFSRSKN